MTPKIACSGSSMPLQSLPRHLGMVSSLKFRFVVHATPSIICFRCEFNDKCRGCERFSYLQATLAPPVKGKMFKGLCICYAVVTVTFFSVAISGYWAFGNHSEGLILSNFLDDGKPLVPKWFILMTNMFTIFQLSAVGVVRIKTTLCSRRTPDFSRSLNS